MKNNVCYLKDRNPSKFVPEIHPYIFVESNDKGWGTVRGHESLKCTRS